MIKKSIAIIIGVPFITLFILLAASGGAKWKLFYHEGTVTASQTKTFIQTDHQDYGREEYCYENHLYYSNIVAAFFFIWMLDNESADNKSGKY